MAWAEIITTTKKLKCYRHVYENKQFGKMHVSEEQCWIDFPDFSIQTVPSK